MRINTIFKPNSLFKLNAIAIAVISSLNVSAAEQSDQNVTTVVASDSERAITVDQPGKSLITREEIEEQQANNVAEILDTIPGVTIDGGARQGGERINIRGFSATEDLAFYVDGAPIGFQQYRYGSFFFDPSMIGEAEVTKGAHDYQTGNGGTGGTIRIKTKDAEDLLREGESFGVRVQAGFNSGDNNQGYNVTAYGKTGGFQYLVNGITRNTEDMTDGNGNTVKFSGSEQKNWLAKMSYDVGAHRFALSHSEFSDEGRKPWATRRGTMPEITERHIDKYGSVERAQLAYTVYNQYSNNVTTANYRYNPISALVDVDLTLSISENKRHWERPDFTWNKLNPDGTKNKSYMYVSVGSYGHASDLEYERHFADLNNTAQLGDHTITTGLQYQYQDRDSLVNNRTYATKESKNFGIYTPYYEPSGTQSTYSFYIADGYQITDDLLITPSIRYDYVRSEGKGNLASDYNDPTVGHDYSAVSHDGWSPRIELDYYVTDNTSFNVAYAYAFQAPTIDDIYSVQYAKAGGAKATSRDLDAERVHAFSTSLTNHTVGIFTDNDQFAGQITGFYNEVENDIGQRMGAKRVEDTQQGWRVNLDGFKTYGFELMGQYRINGFYVNSSLASIQGKHSGSWKDSTGPDDHVPGIPPLNINVGLGYEWIRGLTTGWDLRWYDAQDDVPTTSYVVNTASESYTLQDIYVKWQPLADKEKLTMRLTVKNLTDRYYEPYLSNGVAAAGREIRANVAYTF